MIKSLTKHRLPTQCHTERDNHALVISEQRDQDTLDVIHALKAQGWQVSRLSPCLRDIKWCQSSGCCLLISVHVDAEIRQQWITLALHSFLPVIVYTSQYCREAGMMSFLAGADDYVYLPQQLDTLSYRLNAMTRRTHQPLASGKVIELELLVLDENAMFAHFAGVDLKLTPIEFKLLWQLVSQHRVVLSKAALCEAVLEREYVAHDRSIDMHMSRVRKKLHQAGMATGRIQTLHGRGYRFT